jgi:transcriptional regulator with XRE-family HTH domain
MENFGERLRRLRGAKSQRDVASALGMPVTTLSSLENQTTIPRGEVLERLADYYKISINYFFAEPETGLTVTDAAQAWLQHLRQSVKGKDTVATQSNIDLDDQVKTKIAERLRKRNAEVSNDE